MESMWISALQSASEAARFTVCTGLRRLSLSLSLSLFLFRSLSLSLSLFLFLLGQTLDRARFTYTLTIGRVIFR